jgi:hypothetical protein
MDICKNYIHGKFWSRVIGFYFITPTMGRVVITSTCPPPPKEEEEEAIGSNFN